MTPALVVLFGGSSSERRVSVASAQHLIQLLPRAKPWFLAPDGRVYAPPAAKLVAHARAFELDFAADGDACCGSLGAALDLMPSGTVFLLALHGGDGENGAVQREFERRSLAFTGSDSVGSALAFDKSRAKAAVAGDGVRVARGQIIAGTAEHVRVLLRDALRQYGMLVAKPVADGSSVGLHHVRDEAAIDAVAHEIAGTGRAYLAEELITGVELTVGVVEAPGVEPRSLPPSEVRVEAGGAFDYAGKYLGRGTREVTPAEVAPEVARAAQAVALTAHRVLGCYGYSRTDMIADARGVCYLETNTLPGLTKMSFIPQQLVADGRSIEDFLKDQVGLAQSRRSP